MPPSQKAGTDWPKSDTSSPRWSNHEPRQAAEKIPRGTARSRVMVIATAVSSRLAGRRSSTRLRAGWRQRSDSPKSPCTA
jgi:hypothetical protein